MRDCGDDPSVCSSRLGKPLVRKSGSESKHQRWTHRLTPNISTWTMRNDGAKSDDLTQFLTGPGIYIKYLYRFGLDESIDCSTYPAQEAEHVFFTCLRFKSSRKILETELNNRKMVEN